MVGEVTGFLHIVRVEAPIDPVNAEYRVAFAPVDDRVASAPREGASSSTRAAGSRASTPRDRWSMKTVMHVLINGVRIFFDVEGAGLVPDGRTMREKPTVILLHGGPGFDHSIYKPTFSALADIAQVVFLDHRGNGRSDPGPREAWTLAQWGDDVHAFCEALGITRPIVLGVSFGGTVAIAYATRHRAHPAKLVLVSTEAAGDTYRERRVALFERFGGPEIGALARRRFLEAHGHTDEATVETWLRLAFPLYTRTPRDPTISARAVRRPEVTHWFTRPGGEGHTFNLFPALSRVQCPTLVMGGEDDPVTPIECQADIAAALPAHLVRFERFPGVGHGVLTDAPERGMAMIRDFIVQ
jgi:pimeloyl-ACP methyl ester carboxylesterase